MHVQQVIEVLGLVAHPEGGFYRETFRDPLPQGGRSHSTAIYFLLPGGTWSRFHRVDASEVFHYYAGAPLELSLRADVRVAQDEIIHVLGPDLIAGQRPQCVVPGGVWQAARSTGEYSLVGCTVSPGFSFSHFELATD